MRILLFIVAFVVGIALTAPLKRWLLPFVQGPLAAAGAELRVDDLSFALPAGIRATGIGIETAAAGIDVDSLYLGITRAFEADACGGHIRGHLGGGTVSIELTGVDPSHCLRVGKLQLETALDGSVSLDGIDLLAPLIGASTSVRIDLTSTGGVFRGILTHAGRDGSDVPLGEWEFSDLVLRATLSGGALNVKEGHTMTSGVEWELLGATLPRADSTGALRVDFRARQVEDTPRSRALIGLMPRATAGRDGWHSYRVVGSLASPRVIGIE